MIKKLEKIVIEENQNLEKLKLFLSTPNYMEILGIKYRELQHSNFLAWMMNSEASHNTGNYFLKSFINLLSVIPPEDRIKINLSNLEDTRILREYNNIDLLIVNEKIKFTICIENKIKAGKSGDNQLIDYHEIVESIWSDDNHKNYYIYLTPFLRTLTEDEIEVKYENLTYRSILNILEDTITSKEPSSETKPLIENYINNLKKNILGLGKETKLAQEIYRNHKEAIDFIINNKPTLYSQELFSKINNFFEKHDDYENLTPNDKNIIRILPVKVLPFFNHKTNSWEETSSSFAVEIFCQQERLWVKFCFGAIWVQEEKLKLQAIKDEIFDEMKKFSSIKAIMKKGTRSSSNYPAIAEKDLLKLEEVTSLEVDNLYSLFLTKFEEFEKDILEKWTSEVEKKITKAQQAV